MPREITPATSLDNLRKEAKRWLRAVRAGDAGARARLQQAWPNAPSETGLRDVQHALAREYGLDNWNALKQALPVREAVPGIEKYERLANDMVLAFDQRDEAALQRLNAHSNRAFSFEDLWAEVWRRVYAFR